jgi:predicted O-linked N-acetylglucosamine transferase (SPINDLY family)
MPPNDRVDTTASPSAAIIERAKSHRLNLPELIQAAEAITGADAPPQRCELYKTWIAFNADHPLAHLAYFNYSVTLRELGDLAGAIHALRACCAIAPDFAPARINLGRALEDGGDIALAVGQWREFAERCASVTPAAIGHKLMALQNIGRVLEGSDQLLAAEDALRQAVELRPDRTEAGQHWIALRQRQCKWPVLEPSEYATRKQMLAAMSPIALAAFADDPMFQLARAYSYNKSFVGRPEGGPLAPRAVKRKVGTGKRLRIGYVSSDLREHAVGFALSEVIELHDRAKVELYAYYCGEPRSGDPVQERMKAVIDVWRDVSRLGDLQAAELIAGDEIDVLIDVNGYTKHARTKIFAYRPAPIIVNWCGYPGTMGSPYHHYLIADGYIIPPENEIFYSERVLRIPCNQPLDRKRPISPERPSRAAAGLPEGAFVYASLNGMQKVTANGFARWMNILREVPGSVLWLLSGEAETNKRLQAAAAERGVAPERILFAEKAANPHHLARIALADLFLDTTPYGAHSTAADALTMGLPILTLKGRSFAARFCGSVVSAAGLADLVCATPEEFVARAIAFGRNPVSLAPYRERLNRARETSVLRDIPALTRSLEDAFWQMQSEAERGATPVPDLTNLDVYGEIGAALDLENVELLDDRAYLALYADRLAKWDAFSPLPADRRLWPARAGAKAAANSPSYFRPGENEEGNVATHPAQTGAFARGKRFG